MKVVGVGHGVQECTHEVHLPAATTDHMNVGHLDHFNAPVLNDTDASDMPAILGLTTLEKLGAIIDCGNKNIYFPGPAGCTVQMCPGTRMHHMEKAVSGHLMLPINHFKTPQDNKSIQLNTSSHSS